MKYLLYFFLMLSVVVAFGQDYETKQYISQNDTLPYRILLPENYNPNKSYPLVVFLHGAGERGNDNELQLIHGSFLFKSKEFRQKHPAIVVFPQCPKNSYWASVQKNQIQKKEKKFKFQKKLGTYRTQELLELFLKDLEKLYKIDTTRRYIGGLSMGGMGTFELVARMPNYFAAAFAICGGGNPSWSKTLSSTPFWIFHGSNDLIVSYSYSKRMFRNMKRYNKETRFTTYEGVGHNSWDTAFKELELFPWVFSFIKK